MTSTTDPAHLQRLIDRIFAGDNAACFIEREHILSTLEARGVSSTEAFVSLLDAVSTPVAEDDVFLGRVVEERWPEELPGPQLHYRVLNTNGHMTLDWATLLAEGLAGIVRRALATAERLGTADARRFAEEAALCCAAVEAYARRYAAAARTQAVALTDPAAQARLHRAADALEQVPHGPATDLFSALQAIWLVHLVTSCYIGARDFALGRLDQYLLPFYLRDVATGGHTPETAIDLLAHFLLKSNEITGTSTWNFRAKPIPSVASKQYLILGGRDRAGREAANALTRCVLEAARQVRLPEPVLTVRLDPETSPAFLQTVAEAAIVLQSQLQIYNDALVIPRLVQSGVPLAEAVDYTMIGCCRLDVGGRMDDGCMRAYQYHNVAEWLLAALMGGRNPYTGEAWTEGICAPEAITSMDDLLAQFRQVCVQRIHTSVAEATAILADARHSDRAFRFESLLLRDCVERGMSYRAGGVRYRPQGHFFGGIATVANSLLAIHRLVFEERRFTLPAFLAIVAADFAGHEALREEIRQRLPKFGNDDDAVDGLATRAGEIILDALETAQAPSEEVLMGGFYSLDAHHAWGRALPTTPDGRRPGEPISENQSPVYGTDRQGITALLKSVAKLPLHRTVMGGLNIKFASPIAPEKLAALLTAYFRLGGLHLGCTVIDRATLEAAQTHPEHHRNLCVRLYGYSEFFVALSPDEQEELLARTAYSG
jgi:pyruvate-formate lyase